MENICGPGISICLWETFDGAPRQQAGPEWLNEIAGLTHSLVQSEIKSMFVSKPTDLANTHGNQNA